MHYRPKCLIITDILKITHHLIIYSLLIILCFDFQDPHSLPKVFYSFSQNLAKSIYPALFIRHILYFPSVVFLIGCLCHLAFSEFNPLNYLNIEFLYSTIIINLAMISLRALLDFLERKIFVIQILNFVINYLIGIFDFHQVYTYFQCFKIMTVLNHHTAFCN